jgi:hypothetical protein
MTNMLGRMTDTRMTAVIKTRLVHDLYRKEPAA